MQTYPAPSPEFHQEFYSYHYRPIYLKNKKIDYNSVIKEQTDKGKKYLQYFKDNGLSNALKDLSVIEVAHKNFKLNVEVGMYPSTLPKGRKIFIMSHVLEHVFNPLATLIELRKLLKTGGYLFVAVPGLNMVAKGDYKNDLRRYFHIAHVTDFTSNTLKNVANCAGFKSLNIDEEINGLFVADKVKPWKKSTQDSVDNILKIEKTYKGIAPHL